MNLQNGDKIEVIRFATNSGFKYYYIDGKGEFALMGSTDVNEMIPVLEETAKSVLLGAETLNFLPVPNKLQVYYPDNYLLNKDLEFNSKMFDTWYANYTQEYVIEAQLSPDIYTNILNNFNSRITTTIQSFEQQKTVVNELQNSFTTAGSPSELIASMSANSSAMETVITNLQALSTSVDSFIAQIPV